MKLNQVKVGKYKLTVSMATLAYADRELKGREKKPVLEMFNTLFPAFAAFRNNDVNFKFELDGIDFEAFCVVIWCLLKPTNDDFDYEGALDGPLMQGTPKDWLMGVFQAISGNVQTGDAESGESEGND